MTTLADWIPTLSPRVGNVVAGYLLERGWDRATMTVEVFADETCERALSRTFGCGGAALDEIRTALTKLGLALNPKAPVPKRKRAPPPPGTRFRVEVVQAFTATYTEEALNALWNEASDFLCRGPKPRTAEEWARVVAWRFEDEGMHGQRGEHLGATRFARIDVRATTPFVPDSPPSTPSAHARAEWSGDVLVCEGVRIGSVWCSYGWFWAVTHPPTFPRAHGEEKTSGAAKHAALTYATACLAKRNP